MNETDATQKMRELETRYGRTFLENSLHRVRFEYAALRRIVRGLDVPRPTKENADG